MASWMLHGGAVLAGPTIGNAFTVVQEVKGQQNGDIRVLVVNDDVFADEVVTTGKFSATKLQFKDTTQLSMGENSRMVLSKVVFDPDPSKSAVVMKAAQGVFRMSTGKLPSSAYRIETPVATIGVRGTVIEFHVGPDGTTTLYVSQGAATVTTDPTKPDGRVFVPAGQATIVSVGADGRPLPPTPPGAPSHAFVEDVRNMTMLIQLSAPPGDAPAAGPGSSRAGIGQFFNGLQLTLTGANTDGSPGIGASPSASGIGSMPMVGTGSVTTPTTTNNNTGNNGASGGGSGSGITPQPVVVLDNGPSIPTKPATVVLNNACDPSKQTCGSGSGGSATTVTSTTTSETNVAPGGGNPQVTITANAPPVTRIGSRTNVDVTVSQTGLNSVTGNLGPGQGNLVDNGSTAINLNSIDPQTVSYTFIATNHGQQQGTIPVNLQDPSYNGTLLVSSLGVGPDLKTTIPTSGVNFGTLAPLVKKTFDFFVRNLTTDQGSLDLVGLSILGIDIFGADAGLFTVTYDPTGLVMMDGHPVLAPGQELLFHVAFLAPDQYGTYNQAFLRILTDQFADFGLPGLEFDYRLSAMVDGDIPEPAMLGIMLFGAAALVARRRRQP